MPVRSQSSERYLPGMNRYFRVALLFVSILFLSESSFAREWRGITPLRSTRADVIRLLGQCSDQKEACRFKFDQGEVYILFSGGLRDEYQACGKSLPPETVMFIEVVVGTEAKVSDLGLDKKAVKAIDPNILTSGARGYQTNDGLVVEAFKGTVSRLVYIADSADRAFCQDYYSEPGEFIHTLNIHPPLTVDLDCQGTILAGTNLVVKAWAAIIPRRGPSWSVTAGKIISGQHTYRVTIDTTGLAGQTFTVTAELGYMPTAATSCTVVVLEPKIN